MSALYDIHARLLQAYEMAESGEYDEEAIANTIESIEMELEEKADHYAAFITTLDDDADALDKEIKRLQSRKASCENFKARLKNHLQTVMTTAGRPKIKTLLHTVYIQKNPPSVAVIDRTQVPSTYFTQPEPVISLSAIKKALQAGQAVPGAELTQGESLRIR